MAMIKKFVKRMVDLMNGRGLFNPKNYRNMNQNLFHLNARSINLYEKGYFGVSKYSFPSERRKGTEIFSGVNEKEYVRDFYDEIK